MNAIALPKPIAIDAETVTFSRVAWEAHVARLEDVADGTAVQRHNTWVASVGADEATRLSYTPGEALRLLDDVSAITIWRERAGLSQRKLAERAGVSPSYLAEIEGGKKPGSVAALQKLAKVLGVPIDILAG